MGVDKKSLQFSYVNLPKNWANSTWDILNITDSRKTKLVEALGRIPKGTKMFVQNNSGAIINELLNTFTFSQISGIDFIEYFKSAMGKSEGVVVNPKDVVVIYNLGLEPAINVTFSAKLLKGLLKKLEQEDCIVIVQSDTPYSKISREYGVEFRNNVKIPYVEEDNIF